MSWYDTGTVSVTNGSTAVTGSGTNFVSGVQVGEGFAGPDGRLYEVIAVVSATTLTLADAYLGTTQTAQDYKIVPTQSLVASLATQVSTLISDFQDVADEAGEGKFNDGSAASSGITFTQDQDTGFFRPASNQIGIATAGVQRALVSNTGVAVAGEVSVTGSIVVAGTVDGRDVAADGTKLDGINQGVATTDSPTFNDLTLTNDLLLTGPNPTITLTDTEGADDSTKLHNASGSTYLSSRNGASDGPIVFRGEGGGVNTEYGRFNAVGNWGLGTTSPTEKLDVSGNANISGSVTAGDMFITGSSPLLRLTDNDAADKHTTIQNNNGSTFIDGRNATANGDIIFRGAGGGVADEYGRFDSSGNLLVGDPSDTFPSNNNSGSGTAIRSDGRYSSVVGETAALNVGRHTSTGPIVQFYYDGSLKGSISVTGSATAYNTSSDYRLKENVTPIQGAADTVLAMQPCTYTAIADGLWYDGFLAHELAEVHPRAVQGTKDAMQDEEYEVTPAVYEESVLVTEAVMGARSVPDMQSVDYSKLTPILTAALQEALTEIATLKVRVAALESA